MGVGSCLWRCHRAKICNVKNKKKIGIFCLPSFRYRKQTVSTKNFNEKTYKLWRLLVARLENVLQPVVMVVNEFEFLQNSKLIANCGILDLSGLTCKKKDEIHSKGRDSKNARHLVRTAMHVNPTKIYDGERNWLSPKIRNYRNFLWFLTIMIATNNATTLFCWKKATPVEKMLTHNHIGSKSSCYYSGAWVPKSRRLKIENMHFRPVTNPVLKSKTAILIWCLLRGAFITRE